MCAFDLPQVEVKFSCTLSFSVFTGCTRCAARSCSSEARSPMLRSEVRAGIFSRFSRILAPETPREKPLHCLKCTRLKNLAVALLDGKNAVLWKHLDDSANSLD